MAAIGTIFLFIAVVFALNWYEFGRPD